MANDILNHPNFVKKNLCNSFSDRTVQRFYKFNTSLVVSLFFCLILLFECAWVGLGFFCWKHKSLPGLGASLAWGLASVPLLQTQPRLHKQSSLTCRGCGCEPWPSVAALCRVSARIRERKAVCCHWGRIFRL